MRTRLWFVAAGLAAALAAPAAHAQPGGSYRASCRGVQDSGGRDPQITANCKDMSGRWRFTSLRYRNCVGDIGNNNGQLVCNGGRPGGGPGGGGPGGGGPGGGGPGWGPGGGGAGLPPAAESACRRQFGGHARLGQVTPLRRDHWQVILVNDYGRKASCTVNAYGRVLQWTELGRR
jgi:hypothetical protein